MLKKKFFAKALAFALVMGTVSVYGSGVVAPISIVQAATVVPEIVIDYSSYTATITAKNSTDKYIFLEVLKDQNGTKVSATYCYAINSEKKAIIDLSFLKATKEQYIRAYCDTLNDDGTYAYSTITTIVAQPAKLSIKYDPLKGQLVDGKTKEAIKIDDGYEVKSLYGSTWKDLAADSLDGMEIAGNTIVIRKKANNTDGKKTPASAEVKVKIPAIPKAPKVKIDYVKGTINFGKGTEYVKGDTVIADSTTWTKNADSKPLSTADVLKKLSVDDPTTGNTSIIVRTAKTDKKAASAFSFVTIAKQAKIKNVPNTGSNTNGGTVKYDVSDDASGVQMTWKNTTKGIALKAEKEPFQYYDETKKDWKTIAVGKEVEVKLKDKAPLRVRVAGKKETKTEKGAFASGETTLTCAILPATITVTADNTEVTSKTTSTINFTLEVKDGNKETITLGDTHTVAWSISDTSVGSVTGVSDDKNKGKLTFTSSNLTDGLSKTVTVTAKIGDVEGKVDIKIDIPKAE